MRWAADAAGAAGAGVPAVFSDMEGLGCEPEQAASSRPTVNAKHSAQVLGLIRFLLLGRSRQRSLPIKRECQHARRNLRAASKTAWAARSGAARPAGTARAGRWSAS